MTAPIVERWTGPPGGALEALVAESEQQGLRFVRRLVDEWTSGANRFDRPGEALFIARGDGHVVGVCGLNVDPYAADPSVGRVRHLYVRVADRRRGVGRQLVAAVIDAARGRFARLGLSTVNAAAAQLYERMGFRRTADVAGCTHVMELEAEITVRPATEADAPGGCDAVRRSIRELCVADHRNDEQILATWLRNKTPDNLRAWIADPAKFTVVACRDDGVCGFGMVDKTGTIELCYITPEIQFRGVGKRILRALEAHMLRWGVKHLVLTSTTTAKAFYERNGYRLSAEPVSSHGVARAFPMSKSL